jgi:hypothetical protein
MTTRQCRYPAHRAQHFGVVFAERRSAVVLIFAAISHLITLVLKVTGRLDAEIDKAGGRMRAGEP